MAMRPRASRIARENGGVPGWRSAARPASKLLIADRAAGRWHPLLPGRPAHPVLDCSSISRSGTYALVLRGARAEAVPARMVRRVERRSLRRAVLWREVRWVE
jgi:hypothetical protein